MVAAGLILERVKVLTRKLKNQPSDMRNDVVYCFLFVKELDVFREITEIYILIPALLGLKGNLEMTLASRLSTQVGHFE